MIKESTPISMAESADYVKENKEFVGFIKSFSKLKPAEARELREKLVALNLMKLNEKNISKIIDLLPEDAEDLNKIFTDMGLDEDETNKILDKIKEYK